MSSERPEKPEGGGGGDLRREVRRLQAEVARLTEERDRAVEAKEAVIQRVLPLSMTASSAEAPRSSSRVVLVVLCLLLLLALAALIKIFPRVATSYRGGLPPGVQVREEPGHLPAPPPAR